MSTRVLLITNAREEGWLTDTDNPTVQKMYAFKEATNELDVDVQLFITTLDQLDFTIKDGDVSVYDRSNQVDINTFNVIHLRNVNYHLEYYSDFAKAVALYAKHHDIRLVDPVDIGAAFGKLSQAVLFSLNHIPVPNTWSTWNGLQLADHVARQNVSYPLIVKASGGTKGKDNYLAKDEQEMRQILAEVHDAFVVQEQIPNDGDYRVLLLGSAEPFVFWRPRIAGSHLSNTSRGSVPDKEVTIDGDAMALALVAQKISGRVCVGVDLMQNNETKEWIVLEANSNPALATGAFNNEKAWRYVDMIKNLVEGEDRYE